MGSVLLGTGGRVGPQCAPSLLRGQSRPGLCWSCVSRPHGQQYASVPRRRCQRLTKQVRATAAGEPESASSRSTTPMFVMHKEAQACVSRAVLHVAYVPALCGCSEPGMGLSEELKLAIDKYVSENKVVLFMKGNRQFPQCGFSNTCVQARLPLCCCCSLSLLISLPPACFLRSGSLR